MALEHPRIQKKEEWIPAKGAAVTGTQVVVVAPFNGAVSKVTLTPEAAVSGATATKRTFTLVNKGQAGLGTTVIATLDLITGTDLVAYDDKDFTLSAAALLTVVAGDVLAVVEAVTSTGTAHSGGLVTVEFTKSD